MIDARLNKTSYSVGDEIQLSLDFSSNKELLNNLTNISLDIFHIGRERNNFVFGFGYSPEAVESTLTICKELPESFSDGLYLVGGLKLMHGENMEEPAKLAPVSDNSKLFFWFSKDENYNLTEPELTAKINELNLERGQYNRAPTITDAAKNQSGFSPHRVLVFGVGCLIHSSQNMEGYALHPLRRGYSYDHMLEAVNSYIESNCGLTLKSDDSIERSFSSSTPLFVVDFSDVHAVDPTDAGNHCSLQAENIYTVLAYDRGQRPNSFATMIIDKKSGHSWQAFHFPGYRGNLVSAFNPSATAQTLDRLLPKLNASSWLDLIMRIYADAESESNQCYACLKFWSILEMISKKEVTENDIELSYPNGDKILDYGGNIVNTKSALGKVYQYSLESQVPPSIISNGQKADKIIFETYKDAKEDPNYKEGSKVVALWETLTALYAIRNATAHSGKFDVDAARSGSSRERLAAELWDIEQHTFFGSIRSVMRHIVAKELNKS